MYSRIWIILTLALFACGEVATQSSPQEQKRNTSNPSSAKADHMGTCSNTCGQQASTGCWCDAKCVGLGDCCADYQSQCVASPDLALGDACDANDSKCPQGSVCMNYSAYDWPRCREPLLIGEFCFGHYSCASQRCDFESAKCAPALSEGDVCHQIFDVGLCPPGTTCRNLTMYTRPRCQQ